jgi:hypothetical protein
MFLPAALMIRSFFAAGDGDVPVGVDGGQVAGVQPPAGIDRLGGAGRVVAVALHHDRAGQQQLAVAGELEPHAGQRRADGADPDRARRVDRPAGALRHPPQLGYRDAQPEHELKDLRRDRGRPGGGEPDLVQAQCCPDLGQDLLI